MVVGFLIYGFGQAEWSAGEESKIAFDIDKIDYSKFFSNTYVNIFMMINTVLGLFLLDHLLTNKKKKYRQETR
jgi:hypothetical protein